MTRCPLRSKPAIGTYARLLLALSLAAPTAVHAGDERLLSRVYDSDEIVRVTGKLGVQATIGFGEKESIENVAVGDSESWQITPNKRADLLFVKPLAANARTNMTVVTDKHTYFFDLVASPQAMPLYMLRFSYRDEPKPAAGTEPGGSEPSAPGGDLAAAPRDPALLNFAWARKGEAALMPSRIYDDGASTYLLWNDRQQLPAILMLNEKGEEGPVNYAVRGSTIVIDAVPTKIVLRMGKKSATLSNNASALPARGTLPSPPLALDAAPDPMAAAPDPEAAAKAVSLARDEPPRACRARPRFVGGPYGDRRPVNHAPQC